jgi:hypothetical protein
VFGDDDFRGGRFSGFKRIALAVVARAILDIICIIAEIFLDLLSPTLEEDGVSD